MRWIASFSFSLGIAVTLAGCSNVSDPSNNTVQTFSGTLKQTAGDVYEFDVAKDGGEYSVTITAMSPNPASFVTIFLGGVVQGLCVPFGGQINANAFLNQVSLNSTITKGHYCVEIIDSPPRLVADQNYSLSVSHP